MTGDEKFFLAESIRHARTMPLAEGVRYLRGMTMMSGDFDGLSQLRQIVRNLVDADSQLELFASAQMKLPLNT